MLTEIGPFLLPANHENKTIIKSNPYSWTKAGWVLFIDQPGSVGFSQVTYKDYNETLIASEFSGFLANLYTVFPDLKSKNLYLHGESYAGQFVPHIADHLYNLTAEAAVPIKGIGLVSGGFQSDQWQFHIPAYDYLISRKDDLQLNASAIDALTKRAQGLGLVGYINSTLVYPPAGGPILAPKQYTDEDDKSVTYLALPYLTAANECFNFYDIREKCPSPFSPLVSKDNFINTTPGLKSALHVNESDTWAACTRYKFIFPHEYDPTPPSFEDGSMERVMAKSDRVVMFAGQDDYKIIASGTQLGLQVSGMQSDQCVRASALVAESSIFLQNLTWGGKQGFQEPLTKQLISNGTQVGLYQTERNVTFAVLDHAGHFVPGEMIL